MMHQHAYMYGQRAVWSYTFTILVQCSCEWHCVEIYITMFSTHMMFVGQYTTLLCKIHKLDQKGAKYMYVA